nr:RNA-directed DNA polymerase, eukaryota, reverse transcriptase zinc-binding domain protein [Tanacetum cinerariifolium]
KRTKEDDLAKISTSLFVTNFSDTCSAKDLFNSCKQYGHVVDAYIPLKRSKAGKRFGFVRFINVFSVERLVNNLCTVWIGHHRLHANITRFQIPLVKENKSASLNGGDLNFNSKTNGSTYVYRNQKDSGGQSYVNVVKGPNQNGSKDIEPPTMVLEDNCILSKDMAMCFLGRVKEFVSLANMNVLFNNEGFTDLKICYMGELWVMMEFGSENSLKLFKENVSIGSWFSQIINAFWILFQKIRSKETTGWFPEFEEETDEDDQSDVNSKGGMPNERETGFADEFDGEDVPETMFEEEEPIQNQSDVKSFGKNDDKSKDPFNIYLLLKKTDKNTIKQESESSLNHPSGFTPKEGSVRSQVNEEEVRGSNFENVNQKHCGMENSFGVNKDNTNPKDEVSGSTCSEQFKKPKVSYTGGSILNLLDDVVKDGRVMGYNMDGCLANMENIIESQGVDEGVGVIRLSIMFTVIPLVIREAPQDVKEKSMLWDYLTLEISRWKGDVVIMGDFNEVRYSSDRYGLAFNVHGANVFNSFISNAGLVEVPLGGCSYTWCHKSAMKMSKLDRFFHYWCEVDGFSKFMEDVWNESLNNATNAMVCFMGKLKYLKVKIREWNKNNMASRKNIKDNYMVDLKVVDGIIDDGKGNEEIVLKKVEIVKNLHHIDKLYSLEMAQKAKVKWAIEGDENSSFFHGTLSKKSFQRVEEAGMFKGIKLDSSTSVSHLFYADDAVFVGQWCDSNINTLMSVLECFNKASGLRINMSKSKLMGINVDNARIKGAALKLGCLSFSTPFSFLGTMVGGSMCRIQTWADVVQRVKNRLSKWKMKMLSIGGRLTLLKSVLGSMAIFHMSLFKAPRGVLRKLESIRSHFFNGHSPDSNKASWVKWKSALASKDNGGLSISSLYALSFDVQMDMEISYSGFVTSWLNIVQEVNSLKMKDIDLRSHMCFNLGNREKARFWDQRWVEGDVLKIRFPRIYALERSKDVTVGSKLNHHSLDFSFRKSPRGGVEEEQF